MIKGVPNKVLEDLMSLNKLTVYVKRWVKRKKKQSKGLGLF